MDTKIIKVIVHNPFIKQLRTDKGWRLEFDVPQSEYDNIKDLPKIEGKNLEITLKELENDYPF